MTLDSHCALSGWNSWQSFQFCNFVYGIYNTSYSSLLTWQLDTSTSMSQLNWITLIAPKFNNMNERFCEAGVGRVILIHISVLGFLPTVNCSKITLNAKGVKPFCLHSHRKPCPKTYTHTHLTTVIDIQCNLKFLW